MISANTQAVIPSRLSHTNDKYGEVGDICVYGHTFEITAIQWSWFSRLETELRSSN